MRKTLAKAVVVPEKNTLPESFESNFFPQINMYIFFSENFYDTTTCSFEGVRLMHDRIIREYNLPELDDSQLNYIAVDTKPDDRTHTYLRVNRRCCPLTSDQYEFLANLFDADYF